MKKEPNHIVLKRVQAFALWAQDGEVSSSVYGYFRHVDNAQKHVKGCGWYGSDGWVKEVEMWADEYGNLWPIEPDGQFHEDQRRAEKLYNEKRAEILAKLSADEIHFLGLDK